jgi:hypothetical protein
MTVSILQTKDKAISAVDYGLRERHVKIWNAYQRLCVRRRQGVVDTRLEDEIKLTYEKAREIHNKFEDEVKKKRAELGIPEDPDPDAVFVPAQSGAKRKKKAA